MKNTKKGTHQFLKISQTIAISALLAGGLNIQAGAQNFPNKPVHIIVGYAAGGPTDVLARVIGQELAPPLGQPVVIENKAGANGNIATETVQRANPDGYNIVMNTISHNVNPLLKPAQVRYDPIKDFTPIAQVAVLPQVVVVAANSPYKNLGELLKAAKENEGGISFGSAGAGGSAHLAAALLEMRSTTKMIHVPFKGNGPALTEVMSGRVNFMFYPMIGLTDYVSSGKIRLLAVTTAQRIPEYKDVPTTAELGFQGFEDYTQPIGFIGPAGLPPAVTKKLQDSIETAIGKPEVQARLKSLGAVQTFRDSKSYTQWLDQDRQRWASLIKMANIRPD